MQRPNRKDSGFRPALLGVVAVCACALLGILAFEVAMRFTDYRYLLSRVEFPDGYFIEDAELGADHAPDQAPANFSMRGPGFEVFTNSLGCFDRDNEIENGYILAIGDSATWGFVPEDRNWTHVLQSVSGKQILNCGVTGVGTRFQMLKARRVVEDIGLPPALIILLYVNNDLNDDHVFPSYTVVSGQRLDRVQSIDLRTGEVTRSAKAELSRVYLSYRANEFSVRRVLRNHSLVAWMMYRLFFQQEQVPREIDGFLIDQRYGLEFWNLSADEYPWLRRTMEHHLESFRELRRFADDLNAPLAVFDVGAETAVPSVHRVEFFDQLKAELAYVFPVTFDTVAQSEISNLRYKFDDHWNAVGNRLAAEEIFERLQDAGLLE